MKRTYERLLFMVIGALISFTAYIIGCVSHTENIQAQAIGEKVIQTTAQQVSDEIVTRKIRVVNAEGETIVTVGEIGGNGSILVNNKEGKRNVAIGSVGGGWLSIHPDDGGLGAIIRTTGNTPIMEFLNGSETILLIGAGEDGGIVRTSNNAGQMVALMGADEEGGIMANLNNAGEILGSISFNEYGGVMETYNNAGQVVTAMGSNQNGSGVVQISNNKGERAVSMFVKGLGNRSLGGSIDVFNDAGIRVTRIEAALYGGFVQSWNNAGIRVTRIGAGPDGGFVGVSNDAGEWIGNLPPR